MRFSPSPIEVRSYHDDKRARLSSRAAEIARAGDKDEHGNRFTGCGFLCRYFVVLEHAFDPATAGFETFSAMIAWNEPVARKTAMACIVDLGTFWADHQSRIEERCGPSIRVCASCAVEIYSPSAAIHFSEFRNISIRIRETAQRKKLELYSAAVLEMYESIRRPDWKWFENVAAYANARLRKPAGDR